MRENDGYTLGCASSGSCEHTCLVRALLRGHEVPYHNPSKVTGDVSRARCDAQCSLICPVVDFIWLHQQHLLTHAAHAVSIELDLLLRAVGLFVNTDI